MPGDPFNTPGETVPRDQWGRPKIWAGQGKARKLTAYTRASTLGGTLEDQYGLGQWRMRQVAFGMARRRDLVLAAAAVPTCDDPAGKARLAEIADAAFEAAESNAKATIGTALHSLTERIDRGEPIPDVGADRAALDAYAEQMSRFTVVGTEQFVVCDLIECAGTFDRTVRPRGVLTAPDGTRITESDALVLDLKTSSTANFFGIKFAVQLAVYGNAATYDPASGARGELGVRTDWGLILHVPSGGSTAGLYWVDLTMGWQLATLACAVRAWRKRRDIVTPVAAQLDVDPVTELLAVAAAATTVDELTLVWSTAVAADVWNEELLAACRDRKRELLGGAA